MKTVNYSLASNFVDFALSAVTEHAKKLEGWLGGETSFGKVPRHVSDVSVCETNRGT